MQVTDHASPTAPADRDKVVFHAEGLNKIYTMGEVEVHALRGIDLDLYRGEFVVLLGRRGAASRPCSISSAASTCRPAARCVTAITTCASPTTRRSRVIGANTSASAFSSTTSSRAAPRARTSRS